MADKAVAELPLRDVKLSQLPKWLGSCNFSPVGIFRAVQRGRNRYHAKYINVVKPSFAPVAQFLAVFMLMSYTWRFKGEKHHRLSKYHW
ncbi:ATP synthase subunit f, mitochondrial [Holothuria leucospilota]|uniref:ATP synthase subunit f, mitochondrial n=1 Tax=Holothuria leucospilota TaxID=206669 RepID=A0A9Q1HA20_HOLLE|nr:ATP synthase subunit f, mitochondrial [Holothuria leucospilota]